MNGAEEMTISEKQFKLITLRPEKYKGSEVELILDLNDKELQKTCVEDAKAIGLTPGDTAEVYARVIFDEEKEEHISFNYVHAYVSGTILSDFIEKYGFIDIRTKVRAKFRMEYKIADIETLYEPYYEITAFIITELL